MSIEDTYKLTLYPGYLFFEFRNRALRWEMSSPIAKRLPFFARLFEFFLVVAERLDVPSRYPALFERFDIGVSILPAYQNQFMIG